MTKFTIIRDVGTRYDSNKGGTPLKLREATYNYITNEAKKAFRSGPAQVELLTELHKVIKEELGTDIPADVRSLLRQLKDKKSPTPSKGSTRSATAGSATMKAD